MYLVTQPRTGEGQSRCQQCERIRWAKSKHPAFRAGYRETYRPGGRAGPDASAHVKSHRHGNTTPHEGRTSGWRESGTVWDPVKTGRLGKMGVECGDEDWAQIKNTAQ
ncbi:hypothetical protein BCR44DRAFT_38189 [Catenaria anguillulae PL171]|uniref:Uncharacterized protein n=1 Tax=Catenaria anguillulae PL171 TaxID=765915 RepID=A0A1Y2H4K4_9FUNG|nr:hypothetical protein BCR44DRAFT_38189 [Catenaria anguillulae PL171]